MMRVNTTLVPVAVVLMSNDAARMTKKCNSQTDKPIHEWIEKYERREHISRKSWIPLTRQERNFENQKSESRPSA